MADDAAAIVATVAECRSRGSTLAIVGHGSKAFFSPSCGETLLRTRGHAGILDYRPEELVITARAGTPIAELTETLAEEGQLLPFDPPCFDGGGTVGGAIATGLAGPARPWRGNVRDAILGVEIVNGLGERLRFGGSVMKNVAGYDIARLMVGARGTLGVILSASLRVLPAPEAERTRAKRCDAAEAGALCRQWARQPLPITATCHVDGVLSVRTSGSASALDSAQATMALPDAGDPALWAQVRDHRHPFFAAFAANRPLTRLSLPRGCPPPVAGAASGADSLLIEWGGCQAWRRGKPETIPDDAFATLFPGGATTPLASGALAKYTARIKRAFDPDGVLNPGLLALSPD